MDIVFYTFYENILLFFCCFFFVTLRMLSGWGECSYKRRNNKGWKHENGRRDCRGRGFIIIITVFSAMPLSSVSLGSISQMFRPGFFI